MNEVVFERSLRARRYRLTLRRDGTVVATIPARGTEREALRFVEAHREWLKRAQARQARRPKTPETWAIGTQVLWRGELTEIRWSATSGRAEPGPGPRPTTIAPPDKS